MLTHTYAILCLHTYILSLSRPVPLSSSLSLIHTHSPMIPPLIHTHTLSLPLSHTHSYTLLPPSPPTSLSHTHMHKCTHTHTSKHFLSPSKQRREKRHTPPQRFSLVTGTPDAAWCCGQREGVPAEVPSDLPHSEIIHCLSVNFTIMQMLGSEAEAAQTANKCTTWNDHEQRAYVL